MSQKRKPFRRAYDSAVNMRYGTGLNVLSLPLISCPGNTLTGSRMASKYPKGAEVLRAIIEEHIETKGKALADFLCAKFELCAKSENDKITVKTIRNWLAGRNKPQEGNWSLLWTALGVDKKELADRHRLKQRAQRAYQDDARDKEALAAREKFLSEINELIKKWRSEPLANVYLDAEIDTKACNAEVSGEIHFQKLSASFVNGMSSARICLGVSVAHFDFTGKKLELEQGTLEQRSAANGSGHSLSFFRTTPKERWRITFVGADHQPFVGRLVRKEEGSLFMARPTGKDLEGSLVVTYEPQPEATVSIPHGNSENEQERAKLVYDMMNNSRSSLGADLEHTLDIDFTRPGT